MAKAKTTTAKSATKSEPVAAKPTPAPAPAKAPAAAKAAAKTAVSSEQRARMIAEAAYYIAEKRGFIHGHHDADWAAAERQIDALLAKG